MADKHQREISLDDALLLEMVQQKGELVEKGRAISKQMAELAKQHEKLNDDITAAMTELNNKKLDIFKRVEKLAKGLLTEFEIPVTTEIKDGKLVLIATEALEEFKESFKTFDKWHEPVPRKEKKLDANP
jgi:hypothetical protein